MPSNKIQEKVRQRFAAIAGDPSSERRFPVGPASAKALGYAAKTIDELPLSLTESFAGVGNPLALGEIRPGETVLDLGCGAGLDSLLAARQVGPSGRVIGIDMTSEMIAKAQKNAAALGLANVQFRIEMLEELPLPDASVDVALSNGVFNLCPDKPRALKETARVLRPGGRLLMCDILLEDHVSPEEVARLGEWSD
jgi:SAM-dependent methyltransferase